MSYEEKRNVLIAYLKLKVEECDWHGVSDAANVIRVFEAHPFTYVVPAGESLND